MALPLKEMVKQAKNGNRAALEQLILRIQDKIFGLALKMLGHPEDAEDATQEILIKVITSLSGFRGESAFETWMYRISSNHLLTTRKRKSETMGYPMEEVGNQNITPNLCPVLILICALKTGFLSKKHG